MRTFYFILSVLLITCVSAQAGLVPNGDFAMYKPGTDIPVVSWGGEGYNIWVQQIGMNRPLSGEAGDGTPGYVTFADSTTGDHVDIPGWITPVMSQGSMTNNADLFTSGYDDTDGTSCLNAFGSWSGQNGGLAVSDAPLVLPECPEGDSVYWLSAMVAGPAGPRVLDLLVDGVKLEPDFSVDPPYYGDWDFFQRMARQYNDIPAGNVTVLVGIARPGEGEDPLFGNRIKVDNISLDCIPEPATILLLGLGGLALLRRKRR